jgi:hypothetical protein
MERHNTPVTEWKHLVTRGVRSVKLVGFRFGKKETTTLEKSISKAEEKPLSKVDIESVVTTRLH